jgi:hypothetical protein
MALCTDGSPCLEEKSWTQDRINAWLPSARIFEITRTGSMLALCGKDCGQGNQIQPHVLAVYPQLPQGQGIWLGWLLVVFSLLLIVLKRSTFSHRGCNHRLFTGRFSSFA